MAHFAEISLTDSSVLRVVVVNNDVIIDDGAESETKGIAFCAGLFGGNWVQTSYNSSFRKNFAGVGFLYDAARDAFIPPQPYPSWVLNEYSCQWVAPVPRPDGSAMYVWDEASTSWSEITPP